MWRFYFRNVGLMQYSSHDIVVNFRNGRARALCSDVLYVPIELIWPLSFRAVLQSLMANERLKALHILILKFSIHRYRVSIVCFVPRRPAWCRCRTFTTLYSQSIPSTRDHRSLHRIIVRICDHRHTRHSLFSLLLSFCCSLLLPSDFILLIRVNWP